MGDTKNAKPHLVGRVELVRRLKEADARIAELEAEVEREAEHRRLAVSRVMKQEQAALARAEAAERERDDWKSAAGATAETRDSWASECHKAEAELAMLMESTDGVRQAVVREQERARAAEAALASLKLHDAEVIHDARAKQEAAERERDEAKEVAAHRLRMLESFDEKAVQAEWCAINKSAADRAMTQYRETAAMFKAAAECAEEAKARAEAAEAREAGLREAMWTARCRLDEALASLELRYKRILQSCSVLSAALAAAPAKEGK